MEPKSEREFFLLLIEQVRHIRIDLDDLKNIQGLAASAESLLDIERRLTASEAIIETLKTWHDKQDAKEEAIEEAYKNNLQKLKDEKDQELKEANIKNAKAKTWQIWIGVMGSALVSAVIVWYYLKN